MPFADVNFVYQGVFHGALRHGANPAKLARLHQEPVSHAERTALPRRARALVVLMTALAVCGFGLVDPLNAENLSPAAAGPLATAAGTTSAAIDTAWRSGDRLLGPLLGPHGRIHLARFVGTLQVSLGAQQAAPAVAAGRRPGQPLRPARTAARSAGQCGLGGDQPWRL
ncbi:hypothetical protein PEC18_19220 [Paucibacter sp. O1-1]|nr:hypothetical protein [Paucibacter sp. O1-1]MDA3827921.1 hypothetical protein [Paucibacter sp. O1-1]